MMTGKINSNKNVAKHFVIDSFSNLEMLSGSFTTHKFKPHFHESYTVIFMEDGIGDYSCGKTNHVISSGSILILNPYEVHTGQSVNGSPWNFMTMYIPQEVMKKAMGNFSNNNELPFFKENIIKDLSLFNQGINVFSNLMHKHNEVNGESALMLFLKHLIRDYAYSESYNEIGSNGFTSAYKIREFLHKHFLEDISLNQLSMLFGIAEYNLVKIFKNHFQLPPHQYLLNLRIENSKRLLTKRCSSTEAAYQSGFFDQSHFIRHFKKITGITPGQFASKIS